MVDYYREKYDFQDLQKVLIRLRQPDGCPWDAAQTHTSIRKDFLEEVYEVCEAIDRSDNTLMCEELGDVLWQVAFHTRLAEEEGAFTMEDVITGICKKMIERHPYVFGTVEMPDSAEGTIAIHDAVKAQEKHQRTYTDAMNDVAKTITELCFDDLDAPPVVIGAKNWITPPFEFDEFFFPQASWILDAIHEKLVPLEGYTPENGVSVEELLRRAKQGV